MDSIFKSNACYWIQVYYLMDFLGQILPRQRHFKRLKKSCYDDDVAGRLDAHGLMMG